MIYLNDLFDLADLEASIDNGYIRRQYHNSEPLAILNYTEKSQFERLWDDITLTCRGLIYNTETLEVVARPLPKFFNSDQPEAPSIGLDEAVHVTDKMDGSLGILYRKPSGGWAIATRGSFHSEQAEWATRFFNEKYAGYEAADHMTLCYEIVYPANRIVCDYGDVEDLFLLGAVGTISGWIYGPDEIPAGEEWPGPRTEVFKFDSYSDALAMPPREGKEGIVIRTADGRMVKVKQEAYKALHRIVTGLNARAVWQLMVDGRDINEFIEGIPDEFHGWVREVHASIADSVQETMDYCMIAFDNIKAMAEEQADFFGNKRKAFALIAKDHEMNGYLFRLYDGKPIFGEILKNARPAHDWSPTRAAEES